MESRATISLLKNYHHREDFVRQIFRLVMHLAAACRAMVKLHAMLQMNTKALPPPPGVIASLQRGFDIVAAHITAILLPVALDLLLWLGPRLSIQRLMQPILLQIGEMIANSSAASDVRTSLNAYQEFVQRFNLFSLLRTFPIGVPSLMSDKMPVHSPLGAPPVLQVASPAHLLGWIVLLTLSGWMLGGLYFHRMAALVSPGISTRQSLLHTLLYGALWLFLSWTLGLPAVVVLSLLFGLHPLLGSAALLLLSLLAVWLIVPLFFSIHGIFLKGQNVLASVLNGFRMARSAALPSGLLVLAVFLLSMGLNLLWAIPAEDSWIALVGILGHAFVTTAALVSSFIYYRDMTAWLEIALARLQSGVSTRQV